MTPWLDDGDVRLFLGDCVEVMAAMPAESVDAVVCDPPYGLEFMGKAWDRYAPPQFAAWCETWAREALRVLKPGGHLLAFGGTRTFHRLTCGIEDAGFEVRDCLSWLYGSGFPKSLDVSKALDKRGGSIANFSTFRDAVKRAMKKNGVTRKDLRDALDNHMLSHYLTNGSQPAVPNLRDYLIIREAVGLGDQFDQFFSAEAEREVVGRGRSAIGNKSEGKRHTVGASVAVEFDLTAPATDAAREWQGWGTALKPAWEPCVVARKPLAGTVAENVQRYGTGAINVDGCRIGTDIITSSGWTGMDARRRAHGTRPQDYGGGDGVPTEHTGRWPANVALDEAAAAMLDAQAGAVGGTGGASRFYYTAKASRADRNTSGATNTHPTVKPTDLMRWIVRLVTPPGGVVLDPFAGSGSTLVAARAEGFRAVGIEREQEYADIIAARLSQLSLFTEGME